MITTIRSKIGVTLALVLAALSFAPTALADPPQLRRHAPEAAQVKEDPFLFRGVGGESSGGVIDRAGGPDGYQPQLSVTDNPVLLGGYGGTEPHTRADLIDRVGGPDGYQPQLRGQPSVTIASTDGIDWAAAGSGLGIGVALSALMLAAWGVARNHRLAHS